MGYKRDVLVKIDTNLHTQPRLRRCIPKENLHIPGNKCYHHVNINIPVKKQKLRNILKYNKLPLDYMLMKNGELRFMKMDNTYNLAHKYGYTSMLSPRSKSQC